MLVDIPREIAERAIAIRRDIHLHPELGFEETRTAALVERELDELGIEHRRIATTGVVGVIRGALPGKTAGLRADMDALPIDEASGESCTSTVAGKMHACGHDAHTAMLARCRARTDGATCDVARQRRSLISNRRRKAPAVPCR